MRIFLSGPMGAGKTVVGRAVAERSGLGLVDLDERIEAAAGAETSEIFRAQGEMAFRRLERDEALRAAEQDGVVVALGGGTVCDDDVRRLLLSRGTLVTLSAPIDQLVLRVRADEGRGRPLLAGGARDALERLLGARRAAYAECHASIETSGRDPQDVAREVLEVAARLVVAVPLGERTYVVEIGSGVRGRVVDCATRATPGGEVIVATDGGAARWAREVEALLTTAGRRVVSVQLERGEASKTLAAAERVWDAALAAGVDRDALVVAVGGGVVGDVAGFAASALMRGVAHGQVPTTLLAMVDSSVGGKTGVDRPQGKNLVGTFHQPRFVLADVDTLDTLDPAERRAGLAEVAKAAWLEGEADVAALERDVAALVAGEPSATTDAVARAVRTKARIVSGDEREGGLRRVLNLGHTVGHALEAAAGFGALRHGEAVALGLVASLRVGHALGRARADDVARMERLLGALGLPTGLTGRLDASALGWLGSDKKRRAGELLFVVPGGPGVVEVVPLAAAKIAEILGVPA